MSGTPTEAVGTKRRRTCETLRQDVQRLEDNLRNNYHVSIPPGKRIGIRKKADLLERAERLEESVQAAHGGVTGASKSTYSPLERLDGVAAGVVEAFLGWPARPASLLALYRSMQDSEALRQTSRRLRQLYGLSFLQRRVRGYHMTDQHFLLQDVRDAPDMRSINRYMQMLQKEISYATDYATLRYTRSSVTQSFLAIAPLRPNFGISWPVCGLPRCSPSDWHLLLAAWFPSSTITGNAARLDRHVACAQLSNNPGVVNRLLKKKRELEQKLDRAKVRTMVREVLPAARKSQASCIADSAALKNKTLADLPQGKANSRR